MELPRWSGRRLRFPAASADESFALLLRGWASAGIQSCRRAVAVCHGRVMETAIPTHDFQRGLNRGATGTSTSCAAHSERCEPTPCRASRAGLFLGHRHEVSGGAKQRTGQSVLGGPWSSIHGGWKLAPTLSVATNVFHWTQNVHLARQLEFHDDLVMFPDICHSAQLPKPATACIRSTLQVLAAEMGFGASFVEARGKGCVRMTLASQGKLQYTVDGACRPPFSKMQFEDSFVHFPELGTTAKLPQAEAAELRAQLQDLAVAASVAVQFRDSRGAVRVFCADDRLLQCSLDGDVKPTFQQMTFMQDGSVDFPEIGQSFQLPEGLESPLRRQLQELACKAHLGVMFRGARGTSGSLLRFHVSSQCLQYTVDGSWRAPIQQMCFSEDGMVAFPELQKTVRMPEEDAESLRIMLQDLANLAGLGTCFVEPQGRRSIRVSIAGDGLLQYSVNGSWRPCFRELHVREDGWLEIPELGKSAKLPDGQATALAHRLQELQRASQGRPQGPSETGPALWLVVDAGCVQLTSQDRD
ncbi:unnamed protein product [Symbiodinium sp. CCMP2456]|nr:unnamed protein product [Symbiodinium sp. CCMP2456]